MGEIEGGRREGREGEGGEVGPITGIKEMKRWALKTRKAWREREWLQSTERGITVHAEKRVCASMTVLTGDEHATQLFSAGDRPHRVQSVSNVRGCCKPAGQLMPKKTH